MITYMIDTIDPQVLEGGVGGGFLGGEARKEGKNYRPHGFIMEMKGRGKTSYENQEDVVRQVGQKNQQKRRGVSSI